MTNNDQKTNFEQLLKSNLIFRVLKINYNLLSLFFEQLFTLDVEEKIDPVIVDLEVYPNSILVTKDTEQYLKKYFDPSYFRGVTYEEVPLKDYLRFKKKVSEKVLEKGTLVKLTLDGQIYIINEIDLQKNKAMISKIVNNRVSSITLRVKIEHLVPSNLTLDVEKE